MSTNRVRAVQVLAFGDYGVKTPDGNGYLNPNTANIVRRRLAKRQKEIARSLSKIVGRPVLFDTAELPVNYDKPTVLEAFTPKDPAQGLVTLIIGRHITVPRLGQWEICATNDFKWRGGPGFNLVDRAVTDELARGTSKRFDDAAVLGQYLSEKNTDFVVGAEGTAGKGPCNEAFLLANLRQERGGQFPAALLHVPMFVTENGGEARKAALIEAHRENLAKDGILRPEEALTVSSVEDMARFIRLQALPMMVDYFDC